MTGRTAPTIGGKPITKEAAAATTTTGLGIGLGHLLGNMGGIAIGIAIEIEIGKEIEIETETAGIVIHDQIGVENKYQVLKVHEARTIPR